MRSPEDAAPTPPDVGATPTIDTVYTWTDENPTLSGICFESALDAAGRLFIIPDVESLNRFYDLADNSRLCRRAVGRNPFDFNNERVLVGMWSAGMGCTARHDVMSIQRDDTAHTIAITLRFITEGDCGYELIRPFWIGLPGAQGYNITIGLTE